MSGAWEGSCGPLPIRRSWRQEDLAVAVGVSRATVGRIESGDLTIMTIETLLKVLAALDARLDIRVFWHGGDLDRTLNAGHSAMHEALARRLGRLSRLGLRP